MWKGEAHAAELCSLFRKQYELCKLKEGETVALLTDPRTDRMVADVAHAIACDMGAVPYELLVRGIDDRFMNSDPFHASGLVDTLCQADLILCFFVGFFSTWEAPARAAGARVLNVLDHPSQLALLQTTPEIKSAAIAAARRLQNAHTARVISEAGTDFSWEVDKDLPVIPMYGMADEPGTIAMWGQGMVACFPVDGTARGTVVVQPGDVWILPYAQRVRETIKLEVRQGFVTDVEGGVDARAFRNTLDKAKTNEDDMDPYAISHLGWGLHPRADWEDIVHYENQLEMLQTSTRSYPGNFLFSTGPSPKRKTRGHIDMPMNDCTVFLDDEKIIDKGHIVAEDMIVDPNRTGH